MTIAPWLYRTVTAQPYPLGFASISGAHPYGFSPSDSDNDLRGAHVLPLQEVIGPEVHDEMLPGKHVDLPLVDTSDGGIRF